MAWAGMHNARSCPLFEATHLGVVFHGARQSRSDLSHDNTSRPPSCTPLGRRASLESGFLSEQPQRVLVPPRQDSIGLGHGPCALFVLIPSLRESLMPLTPPPILPSPHSAGS